MSFSGPYPPYDFPPTRPQQGKRQAPTQAQRIPLPLPRSPIEKDRPTRPRRSDQLMQINY